MGPGADIGGLAGAETVGRYWFGGREIRQETTGPSRVFGEPGWAERGWARKRMWLEVHCLESVRVRRVAGGAESDVKSGNEKTTVVVQVTVRPDATGIHNLGRWPRQVLKEAKWME